MRGMVHFDTDFGVNVTRDPILTPRLPPTGESRWEYGPRCNLWMLTVTVAEIGIDKRLYVASNMARC